MRGGGACRFSPRLYGDMNVTFPPAPIWRYEGACHIFPQTIWRYVGGMSLFPQTIWRYAICKLYIGSYGSNNDVGIFKNSKVGDKFENNEM